MAKLFYFKETKRETTRAVLQTIPHVEVDQISEGGGVLRTIAAIYRLGIGKGDVAMTDAIGRGALAIIMLRSLRGYRAVIRLRGDPLVSIIELNSRIAKLKRAAIRYVLQQADLVIFNSNHVRNQPCYRGLRGRSAMVYTPLMIDPVPNATTTDAYCNETSGCGTFRLLSVTNFDYPKKTAPLSKALAQWIDTDFLEENDIEWTIVGSGSLLQGLQDELEMPDGGNGRIKFMGHRSDVVTYYNSHHVFVHLSGFDSLPNVVMEAAIHQMPIVTIPQSGGTLEAIREGETGCIVNDKGGFRRVVLDYLHKPELRYRHGSAGRQFVIDNLTIEIQQKKMADLLKAHFGI